jgi:hypothetical protein
MKYVYTSVLAAVVTIMLSILTIFILDIIETIELIGFGKIFVYSISIILIFDVMFVLLLMRNAENRKNVEIQKN